MLRNIIIGFGSALDPTQLEILSMKDAKKVSDKNVRTKRRYTSN